MAQTQRLNIELFKKVRERIATIPESFNQRVWVESSDASPCGTVACLAGETVICAAPTVEEGIKELRMLFYSDPYLAVPCRAAALLGLSGDYRDTGAAMGETGMFWADVRAWPEPFRSRFLNTEQPNRHKVAVAYLDHIISTGKVLD